MIDIKTHILPFIDDGSDTLNKSIEMLKKEYDLGVTDVFLTPHYRPCEYEYSKKTLIEKYNDFLKSIDKIEEMPKIHLGQEIYCDYDIYNRIENNEIMTLGDGKSILVEFNDKEETDVSDYVYNFNVLGYTPIVAHVERYAYLDKYKIISIRKNGGLIQVNAQAVIGLLGKRLQSFTLKLIKERLVDFIASDVHYGCENYIKVAYDFIKKKFKNKVADDLFINNAKKYILK